MFWVQNIVIFIDNNLFGPYGILA